MAIKLQLLADGTGANAVTFNIFESAVRQAAAELEASADEDEAKVIDYEVSCE